MRRLLLLVLALVITVPAATAAQSKKPPPRPKTHHPKPKPKPKPKPAPVGFTPAVLAGTWTGTWNNQTFNTKGTLNLTITGGTTLGFSATITGNTFGCTAPGPQTFTLPAGPGPNTWNAQGFTIQNPNPAFGTMNITYSWPAGTLTGGGQSPSCAPGISWTINGAFTATAFNATAHIAIPGGIQATTVVALTKQ
jgi:hypothetical protein